MSFLITQESNAKVGSQEISGVTGKFGLGVQKRSRAKFKRVLPRERICHSKHPLPTTQHTTQHMDITNGQYQNHTGINFAAKDGEALKSQQKQDWELTVAHIINFLFLNSDLK